ncbi:hypothetical protein BC829DRAFT_171731 [Chytridium lagenaria]|nr:hypothetical protein BC829DRAFT_171731 [Chytridium lagenaria]
MDKNPALNIEHATRFSCLQAAEGANPYTNLSSSRLLHRLDPPTYFQPVLPSILPSASQISTNKRRHYRLAYLITAHGPIENLENLQLLTSLLDDGTAVFLVHVDLRAESEALYRGIHEWIEERNRGINEKRKRRRLPPGPGNVFLAKNRYAAIWGHVSMVYVQLSGGWELVDLAEWEYMINVSLEDVPLRRSREIFRFLSRKENAGRNSCHLRWRTVKYICFPLKIDKRSYVLRADFSSTTSPETSHCSWRKFDASPISLRPCKPSRDRSRLSSHSQTGRYA